MSAPRLTADELARLATLHDIVEPAAISFWPPAPGWWLVALLALLVAVRLAQHGWTRWQRDRYRRAALRRLRALEARCKTLPAHQTIHEALRILRDCALSMPGTATLCPPPTDKTAWIDFLLTQLPAPQPDLPETLLRDAAYWPPDRVSAGDVHAVLRFVRRWLAHHRRPG